MPIVQRAETDILRLHHLIDGLVNPTNTRGAMGAGLAAAYRTYFGEKMYKDFYSDCQAGKVKLGKVHVWKDAEERIELIHLPTREHFADPSELEILKRSLRSLREFLQHRPFYSIAMPMLGLGLGDLDEQAVIDINMEYLDDLPNIIHASMLPKAFPDGPPKYLAVIGSRCFSGKDFISEKVAQALKEWNLKPEELTGLVSGGAKGVDSVACGSHIGDPSYETSLAKDLKVKPIIAQADWKRFGRTAGYKRNATIVDIATHIVAIVDERKVASVGTRQSLKLAKFWNKDHSDHQKLIKAYGVPKTFSTSS